MADNPEQPVDHQSRQRAEEKLKKSELRTLRAKNLAAAQNRPDPSFFKNLDSSIKKNTAVRKKLAKITNETQDQLSRELNRLNLTRYINEVVSAIATSPLRFVDVPAAVNICSLIHQHYADFTSELIPGLRKMFSQKQDLNRKRSSLRFLTELFLAGIYSDTTPFYEVVTSIAEDFEKEPGDNLALTQSFVKYAHFDILGVKPSVAADIIGESDIQANDEPILSPEQQERFVTAVKTIYSKACHFMIQLHQELRATEKLNHEIEESKGELSTEIQLAYSQQRQTYDKTLVNLTALADNMRFVLPVLPEEKTTRMEITLSLDTAKNQPKVSPLWDDEATRYFYEDLANLAIIVHPALLGGKTVKEDPDKTKEDADKTKEDAEKAKENADKDDHEGAEATKKDKPPTKEDEVEEETTTHDQFSGFLGHLENLMNPQMVDQAAIDFCYISSKSNRKRLVNALFAVNRNKLDMVPFYARLVATLNPLFKDIGSGLVAKLEAEFKQLYDEKNQLKIESKIKNVKFLGELAKFKVCPAPVIFTCLRMCLDDFVHHNIDVACTLIESCGRFLYKMPETNAQCNFMLERMMRLKHSKTLDSKQETAIENAYYTCKPPERLAIQKKERPPIERYVRKLIYQDLNDSNAKVVMRKLRKLDWAQHEPMILNVLLKVGKCRFSSLSSIASLISGLATYHEEFGIKLVDALLEEIRAGLETNDYTFNQRLILYVKFLGEFYNYELIEHHLIFDTLYFLLGLPDEEQHLPYDDKHNLFRIRLICTLLDTCGSYFKYGPHKKRLDRFLAYFQKYITSKVFWSKDVVWVISDTFEALRPKMKRHTTYEEATAALLEEETKRPYKGTCVHKKFNTDKSTVSFQEEEDDDTDDREDDDEEATEASLHGDEGSTAPQKPNETQCAEDDDFLKQLDAMLNEERDARKLDSSRTNLQMAKPLNPGAIGATAQKPSLPLDENHVNFKILLKKGNKPKALDIGIPTDDKLVSQHLKSLEAQQAQQQEMKKIVLQYDERNRQLQEAERKAKKVVIDPEILFGSSAYSSTRGGRQSYGREQPTGSTFQGYPNFDNDSTHSSIQRAANQGRGKTLPVSRGRGSRGGSYSPNANPNSPKKRTG